MIATHSTCRNQFPIILALTLLLFSIGCTAQKESKPESTKTEASSQTEVEAPAEISKPEKTIEITLTLSDDKGFQEILEQQKGKVVLVDFWALWCVPCRKNFHHTVEWKTKFAEQGLTVISVSMDESDEDTQKEVLEFLEEQDAQFTNILATASDDQDPMKTFGIDNDTLPHYRIYDRTGSLVKKFYFKEPDQSFTQADIETALETTLKQKPE
ncbi:TlpA disulfide reductase family protein [Gimesia fumaroli]|uniref:Thiol:disulfide interchange protein TlpA n=1 Tax=Gimesia fumaroli TaxID=2527976 RepID=A0A518IEI4_9PLAN|nr:TlpA disulfide reductase family protein [Gimesia fumaroli]QDV51480.1 Thiol:disulfide interchange protein TlpA [Gimesia fumaroli]